MYVEVKIEQAMLTGRTLEKGPTSMGAGIFRWTRAWGAEPR